LTESHNEGGGRRLVIKEIPGSDWPDMEDMGAAVGQFRLSAYFIGPDYDIKRDAFLEVLARPGADWLLHPWRGFKWVRAHKWSVSESNADGGRAVVSVDFVQAGVEPPKPTVDKVDKAASALDKLGNLAQGAFSLLPMSAGGLAGLVSAVQGQLSSFSNLISMASLPLTSVNSLLGMVASVKGEMGALMGLPGRYASAFRSLSNAFGGVDLSGADKATGGRATVAAVSRAVAASVGARRSAANPVAAIRASGVQAAGMDSPLMMANVAQEATLRSRLMVVSAGQLALTDYYAAQDRDTALAGVVGAIDDLLPAMPDEMFQAALTARAALITALTAQALEPTVTRDIVSALPAVLLAHRLGVDEAVFSAQNRVWHPLFVQGRVYG
jgi:prophage DNA circulation protein